MNVRKLSLLVLCLILCLVPLMSLVSCSGDDDDDDNNSEPSFYGPSNTWWHAYENDVPPGLAGTGWKTNDTAYNFTLMDQFGNQVELYQFYGRVIVLDVLTYW